MVFPIESEDKTLRKLLMLCQDIVRLAVEAYRKCLVTFDSITKGKPAADINQLDEIHRIIGEANNVKNNLIRELNEVGGILMSRDDFLRLASSFASMMDTIEALQMRLVEVQARQWKITKSQADALGEMSDLGFDALIKLRDGITSLGFSSEKAAAFAMEIDDIEKKLDVLYIQIDLDIVSGGGELPAILILRDVAREVERLGDEVHDASDLIRILAL